MIPRYGKIIYNRYMGELWLWMIFLEWFYYSTKGSFASIKNN